MGNEVVCCPTSFLYFDYVQDDNTLRTLYDGDIVPTDLTPQQLRLVKGMQANIWCEYIPTPEHAEYMLYPRLFALAETAWSPASAKEYKGFRKRARRLLDTLKSLGYNCFDMDTESDLARSGLQRFPPEGVPIPVDD